MSATPVDGGADRRGQRSTWWRRTLLRSPAAARRRAPHAAAASGRRAAAVASAVLVPVGLLALGYAAFHRWGTTLTEARSQRGLTADLLTRLEKAQFLSDNPQLDQADGAARPGGAVARLRVPALGLDRTVVEGTSAGALQRGPGRHRGSARIGHVGNTVVVGRRASYGSPFRHLGTLRKGDRIELLGDEGRFVYRVAKVESRTVGDERVFDHVSGRSSLTLLTSDAAQPRRRWTTVSAALEGGPLPSSDVGSARPIVAMSPAELSLVGDGGAVAATVLCAQLVAAAWLARRLLRRRGLVWSAWVTTTPVLVAAALLLFEHLDRLTPPTL